MSDFNKVEHGLTCCDNVSENGMVVCYCGNCGYHDLGMPECRIQLKTESKDLLQKQCIEIDRLHNEVLRLKKKCGEVINGDGQYGVCAEEDVGHKETDTVGSNIVTLPTAHRFVEE